jgi:hypothetical protein
MDTLSLFTRGARRGLSTAIICLGISSAAATVHAIGPTELDFPGLGICKLRLEGAQQIGSGGTSIVYASKGEDNVYGSDVVLKVSRLGSEKKLEEECKTMRHMQMNKVSGVPICIDECMVHDHPAIVLFPLASSNAVSSISTSIMSETIAKKSIDGLVTTLVDMLASGVITNDVQPLIDPKSGSVLLIDMTEAQIIGPTLTYNEISSINSFISEIFAIIPSDLHEYALTVARRAVTAYETSNGHNQITKERNFVLDKGMTYIENYIGM